MPQKQPFQFAVVRYAPYPVRQEHVNIGIIVFSNDAPEEAARVKFASNWERVHCFDPNADIELLRELEEEFRRRLNGKGTSPEKALASLEESLTNTLQLSRPAPPGSIDFTSMGVRLGSSLDDVLSSLLRLYVEPPPLAS